MEYFLGLCFHSIFQAVERGQVDIQDTLRILNDEYATVASNQSNKALMVESVESKVTPHTPPTRYHEKVGA